VGEAQAPGLVPQQPALPLMLGTVASSLVTEIGTAPLMQGCWTNWSSTTRRSRPPRSPLWRRNRPRRATSVVLACTFDKGDAHDDSGNNNHGTLSGVKAAQGKFGSALAFGEGGSVGTATAQASPAPAGNAAAGTSKGSFVEHGWDRAVPMVARSMTLAVTGSFSPAHPMWWMKSMLSRS